MTTTDAPTASAPTRARSLRTTALLVGVLFLITYVTSIAAKFVLYPPLFETDYVLGVGSDTGVRWGAFAEVILIVANIGTAVLLYPVLRRQHEGLALGFVTARVIESVFIAVGVLAVLTLVTLREDLGGGQGVDASALSTVGHAVVSLQEWTFNIGPGFVVGVGNGLILGYLMYRSGLVPRGLAVLGLVGGSLICLQGAAIIFGFAEAGSPLLLAAAMPEFFWELSLGIYLIVKGFKPSPITTGQAPDELR